MMTASLTTMSASLQRDGRLHGKSAADSITHTADDSQAGNGVEDLLGFLGDALALLGVLLLHVTDGLLLAGSDGSQVDLGDARQGAVEARTRLGEAIGTGDQLEAQDVGEGDDVVVARLARGRGI